MGILEVPGVTAADAQSKVDARTVVDVVAVSLAGTLALNKLTQVHADAAPRTMLLPTGAPKGTVVTVEKSDTTTNAVTVSGIIRGVSASVALKLVNESIQFVADSAGSWNPSAGHKTLASLDGRYPLIAGDKQVGTQSILTEVPGSYGKRVSLQNLNTLTGTEGVQLQLIPDANAVSTAGSMSEILLFNKTGQNYERLILNWFGDTMVIAATANGVGVPRSIIFRAGAWTPLNIGGFDAMVIHGDASVDLNGSVATVPTPVIPAGATVASVVNTVSATLSTPVMATAEWLAGSQANVTAALPAGRTVVCVATAGSPVLVGNFLTADTGAAVSSQITYGSSRTRLYDPTDTGKSALIVDTRTTTPGGSTATDKSWIEFRRGGVNKWLVGLNTGAGNLDAFDVAPQGAGALFQVRPNGNVGIGVGAGQTTLYGGAAGVLGIGNATTPPPGNPVGGGVLYVNAGTLKWRGPSGGDTTLATAVGGIVDGATGTDAATMEQVALGAFYGKPTGAQFETFPRGMAPTVSAAGSALASGTLTLCAIYLPKGTVVSSISVKSGTTAAGTPTAWWFGLYNSSRVQLATTADQTTTAWAASTLQSLAVAATAAGAASSFTTTYAGLHYIGIMMAAATPVSILGTGTSNALTGLAPVLCGTSSVGQSAPPAFPFTATAISASSTPFYAYV